MTTPVQRDLGAGVPPLPGDQIQVWRLDLDQGPAVAARFRHFLSDDERARADRFYFPHLRAHYALVRGALRVLLGSLSGADPAALSFVYAQQGKPYLPGSDLQFNVSHSSARALVAVTRSRNVGVDVERIRDLPDAGALARRFFAPAEVADYLAAPPDLRPQAFYNCWTRKEAFIKATGAGLSYPLDSFTVSLLPGEPARLVSVESDLEAARRWKLVALDPGPGYAAALLAEGRKWTAVCLDFDYGAWKK